MRLSHVHIENFRGIQRLDIDFDAVTVVIGENNLGKTSVFDVLGLCLGQRGVAPDTLFRGDDFYRPPGGEPRRIRIVLTFEEELDADLGAEPDSLFAYVLTRDRDGAMKVRAEYTGTPEDRRVWRRFVDEDGRPLDPQPDSMTLERVQRLHPVLLVRFAQPQHAVGNGHGPVIEEGNVDRRGRRNLEALIARVYRDLSRSRDPLPTEDITKGLEAARALYGGDGVDGAPKTPMYRMVNELLSSSLQWGDGRGDASRRGRAAGGSHTVGLLLVLGALLDTRGEEALQSEAQPIIAIEEPEAHLHPILLASTWDVIEALGTQTVVTTNSGELLSSVPMKYLRRLTRTDERVEVRRLGEHSLSRADLRRVSYHIRAKRGGVLFARSWLLVEGESEFWLMSHLAHVLGYDLEAEGVRSIEFAQCGITPLVKLANDLGIYWHLLADGDESGTIYARDASEHVQGDPFDHRISKLEHRDIERCMWHHGFDDVYRKMARLRERKDGDDQRWPPGRVIAKAVRRTSKPHLALVVAEAAAERGPDSVPPVLRNVVERSVEMARSAAYQALPV